MKKYMLLTLVFITLLVFVTPAKAQMSDDAVVSYVESGMAKGKSQVDVTKELFARGVTKEQVERVKARLEQKSVSNEETAQEAASDYGRQRRVVDIPLDVTAVNPSIQVVESNVFGRDIFQRDNLTFAPSVNLPTPINYVLGPGDEVIIDVWGTNQTTIRRTISPDGTINIPDVGMVSLNGMNIKEADSYMKRKLGQIYSVDGDDARSEIKLSLGNIRTIQVNMMGEVATPGTYYLSSLSNIYHALYRAGGVSGLGTLRDVQLIRKGKIIASVDIYDFIRAGEMDGTVLEEGDIVNVPTYKIVTDITGKVKRPMSYELKKGETIADLVDYAAGFTGDAYTKNISVIRKNGAEYQVYTVNESDYISFELMDGDSLSVGAMLNRFENKLEIKGAVYRPGVYELGNGVSTVKELVAKAEGLKGDAFTNRALITREREDLTLEMLPIDIGAIVAGTASDVKLVKNDVLYIPSIHDLRDVGHIVVGGEVARPGTFAFVENMTLEDAIMLVGGLLESASTVKIEVSRRIKNAESISQTDTIGKVYTFSFKDNYLLDGEEKFLLEPYDRIYVRRSPGYMEQKSVTIDGEVVFPGEYVLTHKEERLSDLVKKAGGLNSWAYVKGARLLRRMNEEERSRLASIDRIASNVNDSIEMNSADRMSVYGVGLDLQAALAKPGCEADLVLREGDVLIVPEYINTVKISGNVMSPNVVTYNPKYTVKDYVQQAGGYGYRTKKNKSYVILLNGTIKKANCRSRSVVEPGCEIVIPVKREKELSFGTVLATSTSVASLGMMIATVVNVLK